MGIVSYYFGDKDGLFEVMMWYVLCDLWLVIMCCCVVVCKDLCLWLCVVVVVNFDDMQVSVLVMKMWFVFWLQSMYDLMFKCLQYVNMWCFYLNLCVEFVKVLLWMKVCEVVSGFVVLIDGLWLCGVFVGGLIDI